MKTESLAPALLGNRLGKHGVAQWGLHTSSQPGQRTGEKHKGPGTGKCQESGAHTGKDISAHDERLAVADLVGIPTGKQLHETGERIGYPLNETQGRGRGSDESEKGGENGGRHLVAGIREEARDSHADDARLSQADGRASAPFGHYVFLFIERIRQLTLLHMTANTGQGPSG